MRTPSTREERVRRRILDAAAAVLPKNAAASLGEIAAVAGLGRTTLHRYYPTREALLSALASEALDRVHGEIAQSRLDDGPVPEVLARVAQRLVPVADEFRFLEVGPHVWDLPDLADRWSRLADRLEAVVERGKREGSLRPELPTAWLVDLFAAAVWCAGESIADGRLARADAARLIVEVLLGGAAVPAQAPRAGGSGRR